MLIAFLDLIDDYGLVLKYADESNTKVINLINKLLYPFSRKEKKRRYNLKLVNLLDYSI